MANQKSANQSKIAEQKEQNRLALEKKLASLKAEQSILEAQWKAEEKEWKRLNSARLFRALDEIDENIASERGFNAGSEKAELLECLLQKAHPESQMAQLASDIAELEICIQQASKAEQAEQDEQAEQKENENIPAQMANEMKPRKLSKAEKLAIAERARKAEQDAERAAKEAEHEALIARMNAEIEAEDARIAALPAEEKKNILAFANAADEAIKNIIAEDCQSQEEIEQFQADSEQAAIDQDAIDEIEAEANIPALPIAEISKEQAEKAELEKDHEAREAEQIARLKKAIDEKASKPAKEPEKKPAQEKPAKEGLAARYYASLALNGKRYEMPSPIPSSWDYIEGPCLIPESSEELPEGYRIYMNPNGNLFRIARLIDGEAIPFGRKDSFWKAMNWNGAAIWMHFLKIYEQEPIREPMLWNDENLASWEKEKRAMKKRDLLKSSPEKAEKKAEQDRRALADEIMEWIGYDGKLSLEMEKQSYAIAMAWQNSEGALLLRLRDGKGNLLKNPYAAKDEDIAAMKKQIKDQLEKAS